MKRASAVIALLILCAGVVGAAWPVFRGDPGLSGQVAERLPNGLQVAWTFVGEDEFKSAPVIADGNLYAASEDGTIYCIDAVDGTELWRYFTGATIQASPLYDDGTVYCGAFNGKLYALDARTGVVKWTYRTEQRIVGSANAVRTRSGRPGILFGSYDFALYCLDPATGARQWSYETDNYINGTAAVGAVRIAFGGCDNFLHVLSTAGVPVQRVNVGSYVAGSSAISGKQCVTGLHDGRVISVDLEKAAVQWTYSDTASTEPILSSPAVGKDVILIGSDDGLLRCLSRADGSLRWTFATGDEIPASPVICGPDAFVTGKDGYVYRVAVADGSLQWKHDCGGAMTASPAVAEGRLYVCTREGALFAFK